jgi:hypothetical protein
MSAYVVHSDTIDLLVAAADRWRVTFHGGDVARDALGDTRHACSYRSEAGQLLLDENVHSVNARYRDDAVAERYTYTPLDLDRAAAGVPVAVLVLASVRCLRYQSCEAADYETTRAARFLDAIESAAVHALINPHEAPWGFTRAWAEERRGAIKARVAAAVTPRTRVTH